MVDPSALVSVVLRVGRLGEKAAASTAALLDNGTAVLWARMMEPEKAFLTAMMTAEMWAAASAGAKALRWAGRWVASMVEAWDHMTVDY